VEQETLGDILLMLPKVRVRVKVNVRLRARDLKPQP